MAFCCRQLRHRFTRVAILDKLSNRGDRIAGEIQRGCAIAVRDTQGLDAHSKGGGIVLTLIAPPENRLHEVVSFAADSDMQRCSTECILPGEDAAKATPFIHT